MKLRLEEIMKERKITNRKMAKDIGIPEYSISKYKTGFYEPDLETLVKIADYLKISLDYLLGRNYETIEISKEDYKKLCEIKNQMATILNENRVNENDENKRSTKS